MAKKPIRPGQMRRVFGLMMMSMAAGTVLVWLFAGVSIFLSIILLVLGFYFLFM